MLWPLSRTSFVYALLAPNLVLEDIAYVGEYVANDVWVISPRINQRNHDQTAHKRAQEIASKDHDTVGSWWMI